MMKTKRYDNAIIRAVKAADKPLRHRDLVALLAPDKGYSAFSTIGLALTRLYRAGVLAREKCDGKYAYIPMPPPMEDVAAFGRDAWVYCRQHMRAHETGWCSVGAHDKVGLGVKTAKEAQAKCREWGFELHHDMH